MNEDLFFHALYKAVSGKVEHYLLALFTQFLNNKPILALFCNNLQLQLLKLYQKKIISLSKGYPHSTQIVPDIKHIVLLWACFLS